MQTLSKNVVKRWIADHLLEGMEPEPSSAFSSNLEGGIGLTLIVLAALMLNAAIRGAF